MTTITLPRTSAAILATVAPDDAAITKLSTHIVGIEPQRRIEISLERIDSRTVDGTPRPTDLSVIFDRTDMGGCTEILPSDIPDLIDALIEIHYASVQGDPDVALRMAARLHAHMQLTADGIGAGDRS